MKSQQVYHLDEKKIEKNKDRILCSDGSSKFFMSNCDVIPKESLSGPSCDCVSSSDCPWSFRLENFALAFPEGHFVRERLNGILQKSRCNEKFNSVLCCKSPSYKV